MSARENGARVIDPPLDGKGLRVGIAAARFNEFFVGHLLEACQRELRRHGVAEGDQTIAWVPGSFELPVAARELIAAEKPDVVICLGCIIRGETTHYDHVAQEIRPRHRAGGPEQQDACHLRDRHGGDRGAGDQPLRRQSRQPRRRRRPGRHRDDAQPEGDSRGLAGEVLEGRWRRPGCRRRC